MYKIYSSKNDSIFIELESLKRYIQNYINNSSYKFNNLDIDIFLNKKKENNEIFIYINEKMSSEILKKIESLRREIIFFLNMELDINDFYINIVLR